MFLENLKSLKKDLVNRHQTICSFLFHYKETDYIVLVKRFVGTEKRIHDKALVKLHFLKEEDLQDDLQVEANSLNLLIGAKELRAYFGIEFQKNLGDILRQFTAQLGQAVPAFIPDTISPNEMAAMVQSLSKSDSEDPNKIYCTKVKRNPNGGARSEFNADKTRLLRPSLFEYFCNDTGISFCYSDDASKENEDAAILKNFATNASR